MWILPWIAVDTLGLVMLQHGVAACYEVKNEEKQQQLYAPITISPQGSS